MSTAHARKAIDHQNKVSRFQMFGYEPALRWSFRFFWDILSCFPQSSIHCFLLWIRILIESPLSLKHMQKIHRVKQQNRLDHETAALLQNLCVIDVHQDPVSHSDWTSLRIRVINL
jgi:hypothetical protein